MKKITILGIIALTCLSACTKQSDQWVGFYYPEGLPTQGEATCEIKEFETKDLCEMWGGNKKNNAGKTDYYCGFECNYDSSCQYICSDTDPKALPKEPPAESTLSTNLQTYSNPELGYSIQYPNGWEAKEHNGKVSISDFSSTIQQGEGPRGIMISVTDQSLEEFIEEYNASDVLNDGTRLSEIIAQENYSLNGIDGYKLLGTSAIGFDQSMIFIPRGGKAYIIDYNDYENAHVEIVKTFHFIDEVSQENRYYIKSVSKTSIELIKNGSLDAETYTVAPAANIQIIDPFKNPGVNKTISLQELDEYFTSIKRHFETAPFIIQIENGMITKIEEQYIP